MFSFYALNYQLLTLTYPVSLGFARIFLLKLYSKNFGLAQKNWVKNKKINEICLNNLFLWELKLYWIFWNFYISFGEKTWNFAS